MKARLGENIVPDMQKLEDEGEQCHSFMWHQVALCADTVAKQLTCHQKAIVSLTVIYLEMENIMHADDL